MSSIKNRTLLKRLFKVQWSLLLIPFLNGDNKTILKIWNNSLSPTKLEQKLPHIFNFAEERWRGRQKWLLRLNINITILKSKLLSSRAWIDPNLPKCYNISKNPKFNMDYSFHSRTLLADAYSKHILITLVIDSQNFRKLQKFERDEDRTQNRKSNSLPKKTWNFSRMSILKPQNSISWAGGITNEIMLWNEINTKDTSNFTPIKPMLMCLQKHGKVM